MCCAYTTFPGKSYTYKDLKLAIHTTATIRDIYNLLLAFALTNLLQNKTFTLAGVITNAFAHTHTTDCIHEENLMQCTCNTHLSQDHILHKEKGNITDNAKRGGSGA